MRVADQVIERRLRDVADRYLIAPAEVLQVADAALAALDACSPPTLYASALHARGLALAYLGRYEDSLPALHLALERVPADQPAQRIIVLRGLATACEHMSLLEDALNWATQAAGAARALGEGARLAETLISVGIVLARIGQHAEALQQFREAHALQQACGNVRGVLQAINNVGIALKNLGQYEDAVAHVKQAMQIARELGDEGAVAVAASNLGEPLLKLGRVAEARAAMVEALPQLEKAGYVLGEIHTRILLGQIIAADGDPAQALVELERALALALASSGRTHTARAHLALAEAHKAAGRFELALVNHEAYHAIERAQFNEESTRTLYALQVRFELARARHEAEVERLRSAELAALSHIDALTGLDNRRQLDARLAHEFALARRLGRPLALAMCDIDNFKKVNDTFGHPIGDAVLRVVALLLRQHCREIDMVARYGGEEFCMVFNDIDAAHAERACEAARAAIESYDWSVLNTRLRVTISIGLADLRTLESPLALLADADKQLYAAKHAGKNRVTRTR